jgi:hypothetical protein
MTEQEPIQYKSKEFEILGDRFMSVCDSYGLEPNHKQLIDSVLSEFQGRPAEIFEKLKALGPRIEDDPQKEDIAAAFVEISHEYVERHPVSPMGRFARKSGLN